MNAAIDAGNAVSHGPAYSLWLLPAEPMASMLARLVTELAGAFATPPFPPHVTVQGGLQRPLRDVSQIAEGLAPGIFAEHWRVTGVDSSDDYFRSFYIALAPGPAFAALTERAAAASGTRAGLPSFPHLSLAYGSLDPTRKDALRQKVAARLPVELLFDRLAVALAGASVGIPSWRTLEEFALFH
jgi:hypothetical protein